MGAVTKSYMRKGFLIYEEMSKYLVIYDFATAPFWISLYMRIFLQCRAPSYSVADHQGFLAGNTM
jgi:hypothetical protein